ncbi:MAG: dTDP-4-dehydrorhamnose 3,5-epimerase [Porticoccaceae bacterium]
MEIIATAIPDVLLIKPKVFGDQRGYFTETFQAKRYFDAGIPGPFVQDNLSFSRRGVLRGLHFQNPNPQGKLVHVLQGEVFDVAVDLRRDSPTFGHWVGEYLSADNHHQLWVPEGFAHGFCVTSDTALFAYKCTAFYDAGSEQSLSWDDPDLAIPWPVDNPEVSIKDAGGLRLTECRYF